MEEKQYKHVILGGTFDHFHAGHKLFILTAMNYAGRMTIGITDPCMNVNKKLSHRIESFSTRLKQVKTFIQTQDPEKKCSYLRIADIFGTSLTDKTVDAIAVTTDTKKGAEMINQKRVQIGLKPLSVILVPQVVSDDNQVVSSERIRYGEINRRGFSYKRFLLSKNIMYLPDDLRSGLRKPLGTLFDTEKNNVSRPIGDIFEYVKQKKPEFVFTIGDIVTQYFIENQCIPDIGIFDQKTQRKALNFEIGDWGLEIGNKKYRNRPGTIEKEAVLELISRFKKIQNKNKQGIIIDGEEDLIALPVLLLAPLGSVVFYGLRDRGIVFVPVTEKQKEKALQLMQKFK